GNGGGNGTFSMPSLVLEPGSVLRATLGVGAPTLGSSDIANVTGTAATNLTINGGQVEIAIANGFTGGGRYRVLTYAGPSYSGALSNLTTSTQPGFDSFTLIDNTAEHAIDIDVVVTERNWLDDTGSGNWSVASNWGGNPTQPNAPGTLANFAATA